MTARTSARAQHPAAGTVRPVATFPGVTQAAVLAVAIAVLPLASRTTGPGPSRSW
jgi:hypothetical protein